jgi:hypothetical protein
MWSIGIYTGKSPFQLHVPKGVNVPVLTCDSVGENATDVADPFMILHDRTWYMFFEVLFQHNDQKKGEIGLAKSKDGLCWTYDGIILAEEFHLSYPYVFEWNGEYFMVPETLGAGAICLYKAEEFPKRWTRVRSLLEGRFADPSIFRFEDRWWMLACSDHQKHDRLSLYFADDLTGPWTPHPANPIIEGNNRIARPAGRVLMFDDKIIRFAQDCFPQYGTQVRAFEITELTTTKYREEESQYSPVLSASGTGWNALGMHHLDPHLTPDGQWIACVDGKSASVK